MRRLLGLLVVLPLLIACSSATEQAIIDDAATEAAADVTPSAETGLDATRDSLAADSTPGDGDVVDAGKPAHYATKVVSHTIGPNGGAGEDKLPDVVLGPPHGAGCCSGSLDTLSLGDGGEIVVGFDVAIVDGPGTDLIVFENAFQISGDPTNVLYELGEVSVSDDGVTWKTFPCTAKAYPFGTCAGWHPVLATPEHPVDANEPERAGGDPFDLADLGVTHARFVRVRDMLTKVPPGPKTGGFDLDAVAVIHEAVE
jgi:hypothetical protein